MGIKLILKLSILIFALVVVIFASQYFSSSPFQNSLQEAFSIGSRFEWCSAQKQNIHWLNEDINKKMAFYEKNSVQKMTEKYCVVQMESIQGIDLKAAQWQKLAQGMDSAGQTVYLEWDPALRLYRAAGLPFKSSILDHDFAP